MQIKQFLMINNKKWLLCVFLICVHLCSSVVGSNRSSREFPDQCLDCLAGFPDGDVQAAVAGHEHGKVNFGRDDHDGMRHSVAAAVPEAAAGVSRPGTAGPTGGTDKPSGTVSHGGGGITRCQPG
jgi:hypothetical protein